jgi:hypothetical protein
VNNRPTVLFHMRFVCSGAGFISLGIAAQGIASAWVAQQPGERVAHPLYRVGYANHIMASLSAISTPPTPHELLLRMARCGFSTCGAGGVWIYLF